MNRESFGTLHRFRYTNPNLKDMMLRWAVITLIVALVAGALGLSGVMGEAIHIAWILAFVAVLFLILHAVTGKRI